MQLQTKWWFLTWKKLFPQDVGLLASCLFCYFVFRLFQSFLHNNFFYFCLELNNHMHNIYDKIYYIVILYMYLFLYIETKIENVITNSMLFELFISISFDSWQLTFKHYFCFDCKTVKLSTFMDICHFIKKRNRK